MPEPDRPGAETPENQTSTPKDPANPPATADAPAEVYTEPRVENGYNYYDDPYAYEPASNSPTSASTEVTATPATPPPTKVVSPPPPGGKKPPIEPPQDPDDEDDDGMLRMSFVEHLEELRTRIIRALIGFGLSFLTAIVFANQIWDIIQEPALTALKNLGYNEYLIAITPMEQFNTIWIKTPMVVSIFLASPVIIYQIWAFISPGLYKRERKWAIPFILCTSGLFILGGLFAYFVVFRLGLEFLLGVGRSSGVRALVTISEYFDLFVNVTLGVALVFELPVLIFFLALIRVVSPRFLIEKSRYAILGIVVLAAIITPTPDIFNLTMFTVPMLILYFVGIFAAYLLELSREGRRMPLGILVGVVLAIAAIVAGVGWLILSKLGFHFVNYWPFFAK